MSSLGDLIHAFPVIEYLKRIHPESEIDWVAEKPFAELVRAHPQINHVLEVQTKKWRAGYFRKENRREILEFYRNLRGNFYDLILDLQGNTKSAFVTGVAKGKLKAGFSIATVPEWPNILTTRRRFNPPAGNNIRDDYLFLAQSASDDFRRPEHKEIRLLLTEEQNGKLEELLQSLTLFSGPKVLLCLGSNWKNKQLSKRTIQEFLVHSEKRLNPHYVFAWGTSDEKSIVDELAARFTDRSTILPKISLPLLQNVMANMDLIVAMDSLPLHLAGTTSTPTYSIFGASSARKYKPFGHMQEAYQGSCPYGRHFEKRCPILRTCPTGACVKQIDAARLFEHFYSWWQKISIA